MQVSTYLRISTKGQSLDPQRLELAKYCELRGWTVSTQYTDIISGAKSARKGLDSLISDIRAGKVKIVLAVKIDRMARSMIHFSELTTEFAKHGCALIIPSQNIDTSTSNPCGRLTVNILASIAEFERDLIRERTTAGLKAARANGALLGRPRAKSALENLADAKAAIGRGESLRSFCAERGIPASSLRRLLAAGK